MCGIIGYLGDKQATPILMDSLKRLEYRGYDSAGVAVMETEIHSTLTKSERKVDDLIAKLNADGVPVAEKGILRTPQQLGDRVRNFVERETQFHAAGLVENAWTMRLNT